MLFVVIFSAESLKRWRNALLQKADANEFLTAMVLFVMIEVIAM